MSYQAHRSHRGTSTRKITVGKREWDAIVCHFCDLTNFDLRIRKPCAKASSPQSPPPSLPEVPQ